MSEKHRGEEHVCGKDAPIENALFWCDLLNASNELPGMYPENIGGYTVVAAKVHRLTEEGRAEIRRDDHGREYVAAISADDGPAETPLALVENG